MRIGIMAYRQAPYISANTAIAYTVGEQFAKKGHEVINIGYKQDKQQEKILEYNGNRIIHFNKKIEEKKSISERIATKALGDKFRLRNEIDSLKRIVNDEKIDALVCIFAPLEDALIAYYANLNIPVYLYQLDPFYNGMDIEDLELKNLFVKMINRFECLFTTDLLYDEYVEDSAFNSVIDKISVIQFPKLQKPTNVGNASVNKKTRLLYAGTLYKKIRSPKILVNIKKSIPEDCELVFCGSCDDVSDMKMLEASGVICLGYCDQETLAKENEKANVLINIGNLVKNQLGSKIVDYISTGKPILNVYQFEQCPTIKVLEDYSYKCNVLSEDLEKDSTREFINEFLNERSIMTWDEIQSKYIEYTPEYVSEKILKAIEKKEK